MKLSIIIPVYNEKATIGLIIEKIKSVSLQENITREIIVVDDGSTDGTHLILENYQSDPSIKIFAQKNEGKTSALKNGISHCSGDMILIQDADLEYDPCDYPQLIQPIIDGEYKIVYGSRFKGRIERMTLINRYANIFSNITFNVLYKTHLSDINTCFKVFKKRIFNDIEITSNDFGFETEITAKIVKRGYSIKEIPIHYTARSKEQGKKISWSKAWQMYEGIFKYR